MAPPLFPTLAGQDIVVKKTPTFKTIVADHVSGREVRAALYQNPIWEFEVSFNALDGTSSGQYGSVGAQSLQTLMGFFLTALGSFAIFLLIDPTDSTASSQSLGAGTGSQTTFTFARTLGGFTEPVGWVTAVSAVYLNGVAQSSGWSLSAPNSLVFTSPPGSGVAVSASFTFAFQCRFADDKQDFEQFMSNLWKADGVKMRSVRSQ